jgi:hypothetical protein
MKYLIFKNKIAGKGFVILMISFICAIVSCKKVLEKNRWIPYLRRPFLTMPYFFKTTCIMYIMA